MMNEKFSELYHKAWTWAEFDDEYKENPTYERRCVVQSRIFAELIVQECIDIVPWQYEEKIKKHFRINDKGNNNE